MEFGVVFSPLSGPPVRSTRSFSDWMHAAEQVCTTLVHAGFRFVVFTHSYQYGGMQPLVTMARLAPATQPLRMATQVLLLPLLNAADVAYNVVTLDHICAGRLALGIGLAYHLKEVELGGITRQDRVPKFTEALEVMKKFWSGEEVHHKGRTCQPVWSIWRVLVQRSFSSLQGRRTEVSGPEACWLWRANRLRGAVYPSANHTSTRAASCATLALPVVLTSGQ